MSTEHDSATLREAALEAAVFAEVQRSPAGDNERRMTSWCSSKTNFCQHITFELQFSM
jgi:hypothetical protein